jgi:hypothetical protein
VRAFSASNGYPEHVIRECCLTETGLMFNRARYFDPTGGRFVSEDPIRFIGGVNFYRYTRNNPVVRTPIFFGSVSLLALRQFQKRKA